MYFSKNQITEKTDNEKDWSMDNFIKSDIILDVNDIGGFINYAIRNPTTRIINIHDFAFYMFRNGYSFLSEDYESKGLVKCKDFGEIRIRYKFGNINYYVTHEDKPWAATYNEKTYNNMYKFFEDILSLLCVINMDDYNFAGISVRLKDDMTLFKLFVYQYDEKKYEKAKLLVKSFIEHERRLNQCPYTSDRNNRSGFVDVVGISFENIPLTSRDETFKKPYYNNNYNNNRNNYNNNRNNYNNNYNNFRRKEDKDEKEKGEN